MFRSVSPGLLFAMLYTWLALVSFIKLAVIVGRELGLKILDEEEIPFFPFRFIKKIPIIIEYTFSELPEGFRCNGQSILILNNMIKILKSGT